MRIHSRPLLIAGVALLGLVPAARAGVSDWVETDGGRLRIMALAPDDDGTVRAVLDIDLAPGWKTYWRDPGDSGIPPTITLDGSVNVEAVDIRFPPPERIDDGYSVFAGYTAPVRLPLVFTETRPGDGSSLKAEVFLGICEKVCIPVQASFEMPLDDSATALHAAMVDQAFAALPGEADAAFGVEKAIASDDGDSVTITVRAPEGDAAPELFAAAPEGWSFGAPVAKMEDGEVVFTLPVQRAPEGETLSGVTIDIVIATGGRSVEQSVTLP